MRFISRYLLSSFITSPFRISATSRFYSILPGEWLFLPSFPDNPPDSVLCRSITVRTHLRIHIRVICSSFSDTVSNSVRREWFIVLICGDFTYYILMPIYSI